MNAQDIVTAVGVLGGVLLSAAAFWQGRQRDTAIAGSTKVENRLKETDQGVAALSAALTRLEVEVERADKECAERIDALRADHARELADRDRRLTALGEDVVRHRHDAGTCKAALTAAKALLDAADIRIVELGGHPLGTLPPDPERGTTP